jgi:hypothetical protein
MSYKCDHELGGLDRYTDPELTARLEAIDDFTTERAKMALKAAQYIIDICGGKTLDMRLYYAAMFGRSYEEGLMESDHNFAELNDIVGRLTRQVQDEQPVIVRSPNYPEHNFKIGVLGSFSEEEFTPVQFEVTAQTEIEGLTLGHPSWLGHLAIAVREVKHNWDAETEEDKYYLADNISKISTCETSTWISRNKNLEIHPKGSGGVEVGSGVHVNSRMKSRPGDAQAFWLRQHLAPTERKPLTPDWEEYKDLNRRGRQRAMEELKISEAKAAAIALSPTIASFLDSLKPYAGQEGRHEINVAEVFNAWHDAYDAQSLLFELEIRELVGEDEESRFVVTPLGSSAMEHLFKD